MKRFFVLFYAISFLPALQVNAAGPSANNAKKGFMENKGQIVDQNYAPNPSVKYLLCSPDFNVQLRQTGFSYDTYTDTYDSAAPKDASTQISTKFQSTKTFTRHYHRVDIELLGCNTNASISADDKSQAYYNYFTAGTPQGGVSNLHYYQKVIYTNIYPNIDLEFFTNSTKTGMEYQFILHPGANVNDIQLEYQGALGTSIHDSKIAIQVASGTFTENIPSSYTIANHADVHVNYIRTSANRYSFELPKEFVITSDLIIDPTPCLLWGTYYGGNNADQGGNNSTGNLAIDASGNVYTTANTSSTTSIATAGAYQTAFGGNFDAFVAKFNPTGTTLIWGTYYGGTGFDYSNALTIDAADNVYIAGNTNSTTNIATPGAYQTVFGGNFDAFVAKFNSSGSTLLWATYYGGTSNDDGYGITLDASTNVYITGSTNSTTKIATAGAYQTVYGGGQDAYVAELNSTGSALLWGTYYGGTLPDVGEGIVLDASGDVCIAGSTNSTTKISTVGAYQTVNGGGQDAFVAKFNPTGSALLWGTYYGGTGGDMAWGMTIDASDNIYIIGPTQSAAGIATAGAYQTVFGGSSNAYIAKFNPGGTSLIWGTYYGGTGFDYGQDIAVDAAGNAYITGYCTSTTNIATVGAYQTTNGGTDDAFVAKLNSTGSSLLWGTYYGGASNDFSYSIALDASNDVFIAGGTNSTNQIATPGEYQTTFGGGSSDIFVAEFSCTSLCTLTSISTTSTKSTICSGDSLTLSASPTGSTTVKYNWMPGGQTTQTIHVIPLTTTTYTVTVNDTIGGCFKIDSVTITVNTLSSTKAFSNVLCNAANTGTGTVTASGTAPYIYSWSSGQTVSNITGLSAGTYTCTVTDKNGCINSDTVIITQPPVLAASSTPTDATCGNSNGSATVTASGGTGAFTYSWAPSGGTNTTANGLSVGTYTCSITDANGCNKLITSIIGNVGAPALTNSTFNVVCFGGTTGTASVNATGGSPAYNYAWNTGQTTSGITGLSAGTYTCTVTDSKGCISTDTMNIIQPAALTASSTTVAASCSSKGSATVIANGGTGALTYSWAPSGGTNTLANGLTAGTYTCTITDANGCNITQTATITGSSGPALSISPDITIPAGDTTVLTATGGGKYLWGPSNSMSCDTCPDPKVSPAETTTYCVLVTDTSGCKDSACVTITVESPCGEVFVPSAFSPNGDGNNEMECVYGRCITTLYFVIYDRWGNKVFETTDQKQCWDGTYNGKAMNTGEFVYYLDYSLNTGAKLSKKGNITLIR